jgi:hypothetical protein
LSQAATNVAVPPNWKEAVELGFVIFVVILVVLGLIIGYINLRDKDDDNDDIGGQTYY